MSNPLTKYEKWHQDHPGSCIQCKISTNPINYKQRDKIDQIANMHHSRLWNEMSNECFTIGEVLQSEWDNVKKQLEYIGFRLEAEVFVCL